MARTRNNNVSVFNSQQKGFEKVELFQDSIGFCKRPLGSNGSVRFYQVPQDSTKFDRDT